VDNDLEILARLCLSAAACGVIFFRAAFRNRPAAVTCAKAAVIILALVSLASFVYFGFAQRSRFLHSWEAFHYFLNAKYFKELGYDGLYLASIQAQRETAPLFSGGRTARDMTNYRIVPLSELRARQEEVRRRFSHARWGEFLRDNRFFEGVNSLERMNRMRLDHGFNGSPTWVFVAGLITSRIDADRGRLTLLGLLDVALLFVMFAVVFRTFGAETGFMSLLIFGLNYLAHFGWTLGAFLRQDWLFASVLALCALKRGRCAASGALFAYASAVRLFPALFLAGPLVHFVRDVSRERRVPEWARRFFVAYVATIVLLAGAGCLSGRGCGAWSEFAHKMSVHRASWMTNNVGLLNLLVYGRDTVTRQGFDASATDPWVAWMRTLDERARDRRFIFWGAAALFVAAVGIGSLRLELFEAAAAGMVVIYALLLPTCYYWIMALMLPFKRRAGPAIAVFFACNAAVCALHLYGTNAELRYGFMSWALGVVFLRWLGPDVFEALRSRCRRHLASAEASLQNILKEDKGMGHLVRVMWCAMLFLSVAAVTAAGAEGGKKGDASNDSSAVSRQQINPGDLLTAENISRETLKSIFDAALMEYSVDKDGDIMVQDQCKCYVILDKEKRRIRLHTQYVFKPESTEKQRLECCNRITLEYLFVRAASGKNNKLQFTYDLNLEGGVTKKALALLVKRFSAIAPMAVREYGDKIVE
jgi:hypothetical protein